MAARKKHVYAGITKVEKQDDGTLKVYGVASSGAVDSDGETVTPDAMKAAIPDYMKFGAVREMHQPSAAGTALTCSVDDTTGKTEFSAHVVDPTAVLKVETGVYKGFSIGGKVTERDKLNKTIIKGLNLVEISLVDRPANPEAVMTMFKADKTPEDEVEELAELLDSGSVTPAQLLALAKGAKLGEASADGAAPSAAATKPAASEPSTTPASSSDTTVKSAGADDLKKGMYGVSEFAQTLQCISWMVTDAAWESEYEGDASPLPAKLLEWLKAGVVLFKEMAEEEVNEMIAGLRVATGTPELITMCAKAGILRGEDTVTKAGAKFSKATKEALGALHDTVKAANDHLDKLGYKEADDVEESAKVSKAKKTPDDTIGIAEPDTLTKAVKAAVDAAIAPLNEALEKARKESSDLQAKVEEMGKRAAPGKALLKAVALNKTQDVSPADNPATDEKLAAEGTVERAHQEMKKVFAGRGIALGNAGVL